MPKQHDEMDLRDDGTVFVSFTTEEGQRNFTIRRPLVFEWRDFQKRVEDADAAVTTAREAAEGYEGPSVEALLWDEVIYGRIFIDICSALGGQGDLDVDRLPLWAIESSAIRSLVVHWRSVPLRRGGQPVQRLGTTAAS